MDIVDASYQAVRDISDSPSGIDAGSIIANALFAERKRCASIVRMWEKTMVKGQLLDTAFESVALKIEWGDV